MAKFCSLIKIFSYSKKTNIQKIFCDRPGNKKKPTQF